MSILKEKISDINEDVDYIYDTYFKEIIDKINVTGKIPEFPDGLSMPTYDLVSPRSVEAHEKNPCIIVIYGTISGNYYDALNEVIAVDLPREAWRYIRSHFDGDLNKAVAESGKQANQLKMEFTEQRIKGSIHHELAHWIDDSLHNQHIKKVISKAKEQQVPIRTAKGTSVNVSEFEIESQIHNIIQTKRTHLSAWDHMSFAQLVDVCLPLSFAFSAMNQSDKKYWQRTLRQRMAREGLLGKNMTDTITEALSIEYKKTLNPLIFANDKLIPKIREGAMKVADVFIQSLDMPKLDIDDQILVGSSANFNWNEHSDFDLHLVVDFDKAIQTYGTAAPLYFQSMKSLWNQNHSITLGGVPVELYIQDTNDDLVASGIYSISKDAWIKKPSYNKPVFDGSDVEAKVAAIEAEVDTLLATDQPNKNRVREVMDSIHSMRKEGLAKSGEFSVGNLTMKQLRNNGTIQKLFDAFGKAGDKELTVEDWLDNYQ